MRKLPMLRPYPCALAVFCCLLAITPSLAQSPSSLTWPAGQVLPHFPTPASQLDALDVSGLSPDEQLTFCALAGQVNRRQPRLALIDSRHEPEREAWFREPTIDLDLNPPFTAATKHKLLAKYAKEVAGVVLYDPSRNAHLRNVAFTAAGLRKALPVTRGTYAALKQSGVELPILEDLTSLKATTAIEAYEHLLNTYWPRCEKRFIVSARPEGREGDYYHTRDLAAACGAATIWLDCQDAAQRELYGKFLDDMPAGNAVVLGWYTTERSGMTTATKFGIGMVPSDHFRNATIFAGGSHKITPPRTPPTPTLKNKLYITIFLSDGDNIQYTQYTMRRLWDQAANARGKVPLNWTMPPGLVDVAPGILNYYYATATPNDCFVCGPSGMGYIMPVNTLAEPGAPLGSAIDDRERLTAFTQLSARYLQRAGLRVVTVWDNLTPMQREVYAENCPDLLGVTVQNFRDDPKVASSNAASGLRFERLVRAYCGSYDDLRNSMEEQYAKLDDSEPRFAAYQAIGWGALTPEQLVKLSEEVKQKCPNVEFVRADHYFELQRAARERAEKSTPKTTASTPSAGS
ncbi:discoidin domain-containing protein [Lacipirellula sp.]|uniref:discoidin domain-containing protein n=1 Tax=Lacipirellula sp. TaxID=2691419 RepID=UPI003D0C626A